MSYIIFIFLVIFAFVTIRNFRYGLFIFLAVLPAYLIRIKIPLDPPFVKGEVFLPTTMLEVMFWLLFAVWIARIFADYAKADFVKLVKISAIPKAAIILFFLSSIIAVFISPNHFSALGIWRAYFLEPILFFIILLTAVKNDEDLDWVIWALIISAFFVSLYAFAQRFLGLPIVPPWQSEMRATSLFDYPNAVGLFVAPILPFVLAQAIKYFRGRVSKIKLAEAVILCVIFALGVGAIIFAKSDGAVIGLASGLAIFGLIYNRKARLVVAVALIAVSIIILAVPGVGQKVANQFLFGDWSGYVRQTIWSETWAMLKDNSLFGAGLAGYKSVFAPYHHARGIEIFMYPHNIILNFWSELGMLGLLALGWMIIEFFRRVKIVILNEVKDLSQMRVRSFGRDSSAPLQNDNGVWVLAALSSMVVILVHGLVDVPYFKNDLAFLFWIIFAIPFILPKLEKSGKMSG